MVDPRREAVLIHDNGRFEDKTARILSYMATRPGGTIEVVYRGNPGRSFTYGRQRVRILRAGAPPTQLVEGDRVEVGGLIWNGVTEIMIFADPVSGEGWARVFYRRRASEVYSTYPSAQVRVLISATRAGPAAGILDHLRRVVAGSPADDPLRLPYSRLGFVHPESALSAFLTGAAIERRPRPGVLIFPFRCNLSQRQAVENALVNSVSLIEGPPGTGKTETILNLIANIVAGEGKSVAVVSAGNAAVDNVRDKLDQLGFGHVIASLGRRQKRGDFFAGQAARNAQLDRLMHRVPPMPDLAGLATVDHSLRQLQAAERTRAELRQPLEAHRLELWHFDQQSALERLPDLARLPLLRRSSDRILDYLVETGLDDAGSGVGLVQRVRRYFRYGSLRGLDAGDTDVVLSLQRAYYDRRIAELEVESREVDEVLRRAEFDRLAAEHQELSVQVLSARLGGRYRQRSREVYQERTYRQGREFTRFLDDYPVLLSTCHSLQSSVSDENLLDYVIIDEASQVHLPAAALEMSVCRNLVVVGDQRQLAPIPFAGAGTEPPAPLRLSTAQHPVVPRRVARREPAKGIAPGALPM